MTVAGVWTDTLPNTSVVLDKDAVEVGFVQQGSIWFTSNSAFGLSTPYALGPIGPTSGPLGLDTGPDGTFPTGSGGTFTLAPFFGSNPTSTFSATATPPAVPLPGALPLFITGLIGLGLLAGAGRKLNVRRRR